MKITAKSRIEISVNYRNKHGKKATSVKDKYWKHISMKLTLLDSYRRKRTLRNRF